MGILLIVDVNDVEAVTALDQVAGTALGQGEWRLSRTRGQSSLADPSREPPFWADARVLGILLGQLGEIAAGL